VTKANRKTLINRDRMNNASKAEVAGTCVRLFDRIQDMAKEHQLLALAAAFLLMVDACNIPAQDTFTMANNLMKDPMTATGLAPQFQAMRFHLDTDILEGA